MRLTWGIAMSLCAFLLLGATSAAATPENPTLLDGAKLPTTITACAGCHPDVAAQWSSSAHHFSSFNNPYYRVSVDAFRKERGAAASRFCAGCHEPVLLQSGAVDRATVNVASPEAQAGLVCLVCHSIDRAPELTGNGGYHAQVAPVPGPGKGHGARLRPPVLGDSRLCAGCHKVGLTAVITHDRWIRGQDDWDAWQTAAASGNGAGAVFRPAQPSRCQDCHMPLEPAVLGDAAAHDGKIRSHRFLAANAALPHLRGDADHEARTRAFLAGAVALDLFYDGDDAIVILANRRVGHRFPGGTMDSNEVWLEVEARDDQGALLGRSGRGQDGALTEDAHRVRAQPVDGDGHPLLRRDPQHQRGVAFDASLGPSDPQGVRFRLPQGTARVSARLLYRKFTPDYARAACVSLPAAERARCEDLPVVELAAIERGRSEADAPDFRTLVERGLALGAALADEAAAALPFLDRAHALAPRRPEPLLGRARAALRLGRTDDAVAAARAAAALAPQHPAAALFEASALERAYRHEQARPAAERLLSLLPRDPVALALAARIRGVLGDAQRALEAAETLLGVDPDLDEAHYQRSLALAELGRAADAEAAQARYLARRVATEIDLALRKKWLAGHSGPDESEPLHRHELTRPAAP